jgi:hypothetical protein
MIGGRRIFPFFSCTLSFASRLRKSTKNLGHSSRLVLRHYFAACLGAASSLLQSGSAWLPVGDFSQGLHGASAFLKLKAHLNNI